MRKILLKLLFATLFISGSAMYSQTSLPGTIEVETGDISNNQTSTGTKNVIGSGNGGSNNIIDEFRKNSGVNGTIINHVSIAAGTYDFTFTYYKSSNSNTFQIHSTDASGGSSTLLHSFTLVKNSDTGATTSSYGTQTESVTIPSGVTYITITNNQPAAVDLDNVIVAAAGAKPSITLTGDNPLFIEQGGSYSDPGATALASDGSTDITGDIVVGGDTVDVNTAGIYTVTYNVTNGGVAADEVTRTVQILGLTSLPGTIEVEHGNVSNNSSHATRNTIGSGNGGSNNIIKEFRKDGGIDATIINKVSIGSDGNYDFEFTYYKTSSVDATVQISSTASDGSGATVLKTFTVVNNSATASDTSYGTVTVTDVPLTTAMNYITIVSTTTLNSEFNLDNIIVTAGAIPPTMTSTGTGDWDDPATWTVSGTAATVPSTTPTAEYDVVIGGHIITIPSNTGAVAAKSITCTPSAGGQLILRQNNNLTVTENFSLDKSNDGMIIYAQNGTMSTMTFGGTYLATKKTTIIKRLSSLKWHLIGNPFNNNRVDNTTEHSSTQLRDNGTVLSLASYDDSQAAGSKYTYYTNVTPLGSGPRFGTAQGYAISTEHATTPDFALQGDQHSGSVSYTLSTAGNGFNLLGNPYLSYIHANDAADGTNNILRVNGANGSNILSEDTIWLWDADNDTWITKVLGDASYRINPLQGFFVKASSAGAFSFTKNMETHTATDAFLKSADNRFEIDLSVANGKKNVSTSIRYIDGASKSFDNGYDGSVFGGYASEFQVYTDMLESTDGKKLAIQSLPNENFENLVIPVGVKVSEETEYTFSLDVANLPKGYKVFLEDRLTNTFTRLDEAGSEYKVTLSSETDGRFFIHTKASVLSAESQTLSGVGVFTNASTLNVIGLPQGKATLSLFNMLGKEVHVHAFVSKSVNNISLPSLAKGVYIVKLNTEKGSLSKKIILD